MRKMMCSWRKSKRTTKGEACADPMTDSFQAHKDDTAILDKARGVRSALLNRLCCTDVCCEWVACPHLPSIFWNPCQEDEITTNSQMMWASMSSNLFAIAKSATAKLKMNIKILPAGFPVALCHTAIESFLLPSNC